MVVPWILIIALIILGVVGSIGLTQGINLIMAIVSNATSVIGLIAAITGAYFLIWIYGKSKKEEDKWIGMGMLIFGALLGIGGMFIDLVRILFSNSLLMILAIGLIMLVYLKKEGILK